MNQKSWKMECIFSFVFSLYEIRLGSAVYHLIWLFLIPYLFVNMILLQLFLVTLSSHVFADECVSSSLSSGGQALMVEASSQVRVETSDSGGECEVRLRLVAVGGGGDGDAFTGNAGGSGYVEYKEVLNLANLISSLKLDQFSSI